MSSLERKCPVDGATLYETDYQGVIVDQCPVCRGIFCDKGELETIVERAARPLAVMRSKRKKLTRVVITDKSMTKATTDYRPCPSDSVGMEHYERFGVAVDICPMCHGVWLDGGELQMIINLAACYLAHHADANTIRSHPIPFGEQPKPLKKKNIGGRMGTPEENFINMLTERSKWRQKGVYELDMPTATSYDARRRQDREDAAMKRLDRHLDGKETRSDRMANAWDSVSNLNEARGLVGQIIDMITR